MIRIAEKNNMAGWTKHSLNYLKKHFQRIGQVERVLGYYVTNEHGIACPRVSIKGSNGSLVLKGVCWGYQGEGPRGLMEVVKLAFSPLEWQRIGKVIPFIPNHGNERKENFKKITKQFLIKNNNGFAEMNLFKV